MLSQESEGSFDDSGEDVEDYGDGTIDDDHRDDVSLGAGDASQIAKTQETPQGIGSSRKTPGPNRFTVASRTVRQDTGVLKVEDESQLKYGYLASHNSKSQAPIMQPESPRMGHNDLSKNLWRRMGDDSHRRAEHSRSRLGTHIVDETKHLQVSLFRSLHFLTPCMSNACIFLFKGESCRCHHNHLNFSRSKPKKDLKYRKADHGV